MHSVFEGRFFLCTHPKKVLAHYASWRNFFGFVQRKKNFLQPPHAYEYYTVLFSKEPYRLNSVAFLSSENLRKVIDVHSNFRMITYRYSKTKIAQSSQPFFTIVPMSYNIIRRQNDIFIHLQCKNKNFKHNLWKFGQPLTFDFSYIWCMTNLEIILWTCEELLKILWRFREGEIIPSPIQKIWGSVAKNHHDYWGKLSEFFFVLIIHKYENSVLQ